MRDLRRRRAKIHLSIEDITRLIQLPDDLTAVTLTAQSDPDGISLIVEGDHLDLLWEGQEAPILRHHREDDVITDDAGVKWHRTEWIYAGQPAASRAPRIVVSNPAPQPTSGAITEAMRRAAVQ